MSEWFIYAKSFAAPFVSDDSTDYEEAESAEQALTQFAARYTHPAGLYAATAFTSADAYHKGDKPVALWLCNHEREKQRLTKDLHGYSYYGSAPGEFEINGEKHHIDNPMSGSVVVP